MTEPEYRANLIARFPRLTSMEALARHENAMAKRSWGKYLTPERVEASPSAAETRARRASWAAIFARLSPVTAETAADALVLPRKSTHSRLQSLVDGGFVTRIEGRPIRWHINTEGRQG